MPVLPRFPGGRGAAGYKYQSGDVGGVTYSMDAGGSLFLKWSDPADILLGDKVISEWKGTIVVCKEGSAPKSVDDGTIICDSTVKDQYKETGLPVGVGGPGYYYGVFPYTKDYVVNVDGANTVYVLSEGYDAALENASWSDIAYIAVQGRAAEIWKVGDEIDIVLSGDYKGSVTMQIAGFDHDALASGGKAGITFLSKQVLGAVVMNKNTQCYDWRETALYNEELPKIKASLPDALQKVIKTVLKSCTNCNNSGYDHVTEDDVFIPSLAEVVLKDGSYTSTIKRFPDDGIRYEIFETLSDKRKDKISGGLDNWWLRTPYSDRFTYVDKDSSAGYVDLMYPNRAYGVCFGFCI